MDTTISLEEAIELLKASWAVIMDGDDYTPFHPKIEDLSDDDPELEFLNLGCGAIVFKAKDNPGPRVCGDSLILMDSTLTERSLILLESMDLQKVWEGI